MKTKKIFLSIILMTMIMILLSGGISQAALQANPNTHGKKTLNLSSWISQIRQMEAADGAMGLAETIGSNLTGAESNGIDVHMMKTTEYGAMAILSASGYGNPSNEAAITSTTGNNTGVMIDTTQWEWTAGSAGAGIPSGADARYYDLYTTETTSVKVGDALGSETAINPGCATWHGARYSDWVNAGHVRQQWFLSRSWRRILILCCQRLQPRRRQLYEGWPCGSSLRCWTLMYCPCQ